MNGQDCYDHEDEGIDSMEEDNYESLLDGMDGIFQKMWHDKYGPITREELSRQLCANKAIKNDTELYEEYIGWRKITLGDHFEVYCRGKINDVYHVFKINIYAAITNNLSGPHLLSIEGGEPFWVHSLTAMRKKFLNFEDYVSFERSSFLTFECLTLTPVRIKMLRQNIDLPTDQIPDKIYTQPDKYYFYSAQDIKKPSTELSPRSVNQINRLLFSIKQVYFRDGVELPNKFYSV
jgi:hypothetical protein